MASQIIHNRVFIVLFSSKDENIGIMKQTRSTHVEDMSKSHKITRSLHDASIMLHERLHTNGHKAVSHLDSCMWGTEIRMIVRRRLIINTVYVHLTKLSGFSFDECPIHLKDWVLNFKTPT